MKKCFAITMFGEPFGWIEKYIDNVQQLEQYGWYWKIFTPNMVSSKGNVEVIPMTISQFNNLVKIKLDAQPQIFITPYGIPSHHITDYYVFSGVIFEDYLKDMDFWGITNLDMMYGRLDHFFPDSFLEDCDVFTDDVNTINGIFSLYRNTEKVNNLFRYIPYWKTAIEMEPCQACVQKQAKHVFPVLKEIRYKYPKYYPMHSHDRLEQHVKSPQLEIKDDGSLWELFRDVNGPDWEHKRPYIGREIPYFHFCKTKRWPI